MEQNQLRCLRRCTKLFLIPSLGEICCDGAVDVIATTPRVTKYTIKDIEANLPSACQYPNRRSLITCDLQEQLDEQEARNKKRKSLFTCNHP
jgi:hypothetical protein